MNNYELLRAVFSYVASFVGIIVLFPIVVLFLILVAIESRCNPVFSQKRVGKNKKTFNCYKIRTMKVSAPEAGSHEVSAAYITSVGKVLRKTKIDEIPQLINVLKGDIWLVGYRPCLPTQLEVISQRDQYKLHEDKPGITGVAQIRNIDMSEPALLASVDASYIGKQSLVLDLKILLQTAIGKGLGDAVEKA